MKIRLSLLEKALGDVGVAASITGFELGHEEYVTLLEFAEMADALRFMGALTMRLHDAGWDPIGILDSTATVEASSRKGRNIVRFRGWKLED